MFLHGFSLASRPRKHKTYRTNGYFPLLNWT
jgi:hypothetical protein